MSTVAVNIFEQASRLKIRFQFRGQISVEDLWDLPLPALDAIFGSLKMEQKPEESLMGEQEEDAIIALQIEIVKHVFTTKRNEQEERRQAADREAQKRKIMGIIAEKQEESLRAMPVEELMKLIV